MGPRGLRLAALPMMTEAATRRAPAARAEPVPQASLLPAEPAARPVEPVERLAEPAARVAPVAQRAVPVVRRRAAARVRSQRVARPRRAAWVRAELLLADRARAA